MRAMLHLCKGAPSKSPRFAEKEDTATQILSRWSFRGKGASRSLSRRCGFLWMKLAVGFVEELEGEDEDKDERRQGEDKEFREDDELDDESDLPAKRAAMKEMGNKKITPLLKPHAETASERVWLSSLRMKMRQQRNK